MNAKRIPSLDGLRAVSILLVMFGHLCYLDKFPIHHNGITDSFAHHGVIIFFVISGFLITTLLLKEKESGNIDIKSFYQRRAWRILPVAYLYIVVAEICSHFSLRSFLMAATYTTSYSTMQLPWQLGHLWSLSVELKQEFRNLSLRVATSCRPGNRPEGACLPLITNRLRLLLSLVFVVRMKVSPIDIPLRFIA